MLPIVSALLNPSDCIFPSTDVDVCVVVDVVEYGAVDLSRVGCTTAEKKRAKAVAMRLLGMM